MKKIFKISLGAVLAAMPMVALADPEDQATAAITQYHKPVAGNPTQNANGPVATAAPKYAMVPQDANDSVLATAKYVKGAYNAAIKGINAVQSEITDKTTEIGNDYATQSGVAETVKKAVLNGGELSQGAMKNTSTYSATSLTGAEVTGTATGKVNVMAAWNDASPTTIDATAQLGDVTSVSGGVNGGITAGSVTGSFANGAQVSVDSYHAS